MSEHSADQPVTPLNVVGRSLERNDGLGHVTGRDIYTADRTFPGMLHLKLVRSPVHHARLRGIDLRESEKVPGYVAALTAGDVPHNLYTILGLIGVEPEEEWVLTPIGERVRFKGEGVAAIVAETEAAALEAVARARLDLEELPAVFDMDEALAPGAPVVLADTQDNPGAGGNGDTTGLLAALIEQHAEDAVLGLLIDPEAAERAREAGQGATLGFSLGGRSNIAGDAPLEGEFTVERIGDGRFTCTGPMFKGFRMQLGTMALLRSRAAPGVRVVIASRKVQAADQEMFRHLGVEPRTQRVLGLKSSVHFRADFQPIAKEVLVVKSPGPALADPAEFHWTKLRPGVRLRPLGPVHRG